MLGPNVELRHIIWGQEKSKKIGIKNRGNIFLYIYCQNWSTLYQYLNRQMSHAMKAEKSVISKASKTVCAGAIASFLTQPFEVLKTNMINSPSLYIKDLHAKIISNGWMQYMRGGSIAVIRQGYGFTLYTSMINFINKKLDHMEDLNKYYRYSIAAFVAKWTAMMFEAPLTLLKTRIQVVSSSSIKEELRQIMKNPKKQMFKGLKATIVRQSFYSLAHYNTYRFLKDDFFMERMKLDSTFLPAFLAGVFAITVSQPLEVIRSMVSIRGNTTMTECIESIWMKQGWRGFFVGFIPRMCRKPINSGICWTIMESVKEY